MNVVVEDAKNELVRLYAERDKVWIQHNKLNYRIRELERLLGVD